MTLRSAPINSPANTAHSGRGPLAVLRRAKSIKNASETEREALLGDADRLETWAAYVVLGAIVFEAVIWASPLCPFLFKLGNFLADAAVAIGVYGEMRFGHVVGDVLRTRLAEATERAANADLARVKLEAQLADRHLTETQFNELQTLKGKVDSVIITTAPNSGAVRFAGEIALALHLAGIEVKQGPPRIGLVWSNLYLVFPLAPADWRSEPLYVAFHKAGISVGCGTRAQTPMVDLPTDIPVIMVGEKGGLKSSAPPFMAGLAFPRNADEK